MNLLNQFQQFISQENLFSPKDKLLLAVSGGIDSVALCELCHQAGYDFIIAHCNFQLRGQESDRDEEFVKDIARKYNKHVLTKHFKTDLYAAENKVSIQVAARELRYAWFLSIVDGRALIANSQDMQNALLPTIDFRRPAFIVTAHHLDDNIETMLMNFFKGTGIAGLRGMLPKHGHVVRPLLFAKKTAVKKFAEENKLAWVEDSSNLSDKYARNYFRNQLIPLVKNIYPEADNNLANNLRRFKDIEMLYHQSIDQHKKRLLEYRGNEIHIPVLKLKKTVPLYSVVYEIVKSFHFSADQVEEMIALLDSETGKFIQSSSHRVIKNRSWIIITPNQTTAAENILIEQTGRVEFTNGILELGHYPISNLSISNSPDVAFLDAKEISFPLLLRKWKAGDYFYPLGMKKKKKLSRYLIDQKLSKTDKEKIWVLETNKKIVWVIGQRIDDRFKITTSTDNILRIILNVPVHV